MKVHGSCHCGAITFTAEVDPTRVVVCHCTDCQTLSGAPMRAIVPAAMDSLRLHGTPKVYVKVAQSGSRRAQAFCPECGTALYGAAADNPTHAAIRLGCLAERQQLKPSRQIWMQSAAAWALDLSQVPGCTQQ